MPTKTRKTRINRDDSAGTRKPPQRNNPFISRDAAAGKTAMARKIATRPASYDATTRTIDATICTDTPVTIYDWNEGEFVDELLVPSGMKECPCGVQLRDTHFAYSNECVVGSVGEFVINEKSIDATFEFVDSPDVEPLLARVSQGHLNGCSIGGCYTESDYTEIEPGQTKSVRGKSYTAGVRTLRVVFRWELEHVAIVVRGADENALMRSKQSRKKRTATRNSSNSNQSQTGDNSPNISANQRSGNNPGDSRMKFSKRALAFLRSLGLSATADHAAAVAFARALNADQRSQLFAIRGAKQVVEAASTDDDDDDFDDLDTVGSVATQTATETATQRSVATPATDTAINRAELAAALAADRNRIATIRGMATADIPAELVNRACDEGWTVEQAGNRFYQQVQRRSAPAIDNNQPQRGAAIHSQRTAGVESLQAAVLMRHGINLENPLFATEAARSVFERAEMLWLWELNRGLQDRGQSNDAERIVEVGRRHRHESAMRVCERILAARGRSVPSNPDTLIERSFQTSYLPRVFGSIISAGMIMGYQQYPDSTVGWVSEADWADFRDNQPIGIDARSSLKKHTRGTQAKDVELGDIGDKYRVDRFCGKFTLDDMDIIDDRVGANQTMPTQLGIMAASLRPDLIYAILLTNGNLLDGNPLFDAVNRANLLTSNALSVPGLAAAEAAMGQQKITDNSGRSKALNLRAGFLIVPRALRATGKQVTMSTTVVTGNTTPVGSINPHDGEYQLRSDARLDVGVVDPRTDTAVAGSVSKWFIAEMTGTQTLQVGYRQGTGRAPQVRTTRLSQPGQFGIGWDVVHDIGVGVITGRGLLQSS